MSDIPFNPVLMTDALVGAGALGPPPGANSESHFNEQLLRNPSSQPMLLDEIRFELDINNPIVPGSCVWTNIKVDGRELTKDFVPISSLGKMLNWAAGDNAAGFGIAFPPPVYTWKFPKPLFVRANAPVSIKVRYMNGLFTSPQVVGTIAGPTQVLTNVRVILVGRTLPADAQPPATIPVPYAVAWTAPPVVCGGAPVFYATESTEADLINALPQPLKVQRFIGHVTVWDTGVNFYDSYWLGWQPLAVNNIEIGSRFLFTKMVRGDGRITVRDETPFHHLFSAIDKSWTVNTVVPSGQFYKVFLRTDDMSAQPAARHLPQISMVGYREVRL